MAAARLKDVAERAGVSVKTVSNVVRGEVRVAEATRSRVLSAIDELGYRPNTSARRLRTGRSGVIALAVPELTGYFSEFVACVFAEATSHGLTVMIEQTGGDPRAELRIATGSGDQVVDGVILSPLRLSPADLAAHERRLPLVLLGERDYDVPADHVLIDNVAAARAATLHLAAAGRRRLAALGAQQGQFATTSQRLHGFQLALHEAGLVFDPRLAPPLPDLLRRHGLDAMRGLLASGPPPDGVFCFNDEVAHGALRALHEAGLRCPADVAVVGFDDIDESRYAVPSLTSVAPDKPALARAAVSALLARIGEPEARPHAVLHAPWDLRIRESTVGGTVSP
ncbi:LacI family DNA-binding transcriptional regulator [Streptomyces sp. NPDC060194]|uniref:LacI family DNA-binding transcriptional regulator n=1 Tax=Streptomyces sp. NPDC060194 TaxID=3347069 RepID=UPI00364B0294